FDSALDNRAWPNWSDEQKGWLGEIRVGQLGLLGFLETILGLRGPDVPEGIRVASLIAFLGENKTAFWVKSAEVDPFGVARELLSLHDFLVMHGWRGEAITPRLIDLASLSKNILPGVAQRLGAVLSDLDDYDGELPQITLLEPIDALPSLWQSIFKKLQKIGTSCEIMRVVAIRGDGNDLGAARHGKFTPVSDGSLQLIRQDGVLQAAEDIAAWLAVVREEEGLQDTVVIGADAVLDSALHRFGLPATGAPAESGNSLLQLLPLVLAMGWSPPDPARIMELLTLPASPVPQGIGRMLSAALSKWPALGSELWQEKLAEGLDAIEDQGRREKTEERLDLLFTSTVDDEYPVVEIHRRVDMLTNWLYGRFQGDEAAFPALNQCAMFLSMVDAMGDKYVNEPLMRKLVDEATSSQMVSPSLKAQAGLASIPEPEVILGKAKRIVWWNFSRGMVAPLTVPLFSGEEQSALEKAGVCLPDSAMLAGSRAVRWRRPLDCAAQQLILVCPMKDGAGEEMHPHPLWDELLAASEDSANMLVVKKIRENITPPTVTPGKRSLPVPEIRWEVQAGTVKPRDVESPSSLENFLGCPLKWSLQYNGRIRSGHPGTLPKMTPTLGSLAHDLVEEVLLINPLPSPENGATLVREIFDQKAPSLVANLFQDGMEAEREKIRNTVVFATRSLLQHFHDAGAYKINIEQKLTGVFGSQKLQGYADIVLDKPFSVIDLKRSWAKFFKEKMRSGTALQIVIYGWLLKEARGRFPELAYYTLEDQTFLTTDPIHFKGGEEVDTPSIEDVWQAFEETFNEAWKVLKSGIVFCPGNGDEVKSTFDKGRLTLEPPCRFCEYDVLCGRRFS
ncbi:MAG: PD-(D/E)XK nuclease family protein, partial [Desulfobacterales bacterium]|nr:PD-(D/E)XK nuclease family protein [Desulfobacterales bacterium]